MDAQGRACDASLGSTPLLRNVTKGQVINSAAFLLFSVGLLHSKREPRTTPSVSALKIVKDPGCAHADHVLAWRGSNKFLIQVGDPKNAARGHTPWNGRRETGGQTSNWSAKICFDSHGFFGGKKPWTKKIYERTTNGIVPWKIYDDIVSESIFSTILSVFYRWLRR